MGVSILETTFAGIVLKNPVMTASGTFGREYASLTDVTKLGAVIPKSVTYAARTGNPPPRIWETTAGMLNSIGLENHGARYFVDEEMPFWRAAGATVIASVAGETVDEFVRAAEILTEADDIAALEINVSCPNVDRGGIQFGCRPRLAADVTAAVKEVARCPVIVKLTPNVTSIADVAKAVEAAGADAVSLINTIMGMAIDIELGRPVLGRGIGGLSGPAIKPIALRHVYEAAGAVKIPVIGIGGIADSDDAVEFMMAGAAAVQVGTATFVDPQAAENVAAGLESFLTKHGYDNVSQLIGKARQ
jgi:dihydroorotate dehydrogenase (NAD+) catalytic subunit